MKCKTMAAPSSSLLSIAFLFCALAQEPDLSFMHGLLLQQVCFCQVLQALGHLGRGLAKSPFFQSQCVFQNQCDPDSVEKSSHD